MDGVDAVKNYWAGLAVQVTWNCASQEAGSRQHPCLGNCAWWAHSHLLLEVFYDWSVTVFTTFEAVYSSVSSNSSYKIIFNILTKNPKVSQTWWFFFLCILVVLLWCLICSPYQAQPLSYFQHKSKLASSFAEMSVLPLSLTKHWRHLIW